MAEDERAEKDEQYARRLLRDLQGQALTGGTKKPIPMVEVTGETSAGPYWQREVWERHYNKVIKALMRECGFSQEEAEKAVKENSEGVIIWDDES